MQIVRGSHFISGFYFAAPVDEIPALTHCGEARFCRGYVMESHHHSGFEFLFVSRGSANWQTGATTAQAGPPPTVVHTARSWACPPQSYRQEMGDLFIAHPGQSHRTGPEANPENQHTWLGVELERLGAQGIRLARELRRSHVHLLPSCHEVEPLLHAIIAQMQMMRPRRAPVVRSLLQSFTSILLQRLARDRLPPHSKRLTPLLPYSTAVRRVVSYMQENLDQRIPLGDFAAIATTRSVPHFCHQFRNEVGISPAAYHTRLRMEAAREALQQPSAEITTVALEFGFSSSQHFSKLFRRMYATTPRTWMQHVRGLGPARASDEKSSRPVARKRP